MAVPVRVRRRNGHEPLPVWEPFTTQPRAWDQDPFAQLQALTERFFELARSAFERWPGLVPRDGASWPLSEVEDQDEAYVVRLELPGVKRDDVEVELSGRRLTVRAERKQTERKGLVRRGTRRTGSFFFETLLPAELHADDIEATLDAGVLTLRLPKPSPRRKIKIATR